MKLPDIVGKTVEHVEFEENLRFGDDPRWVRLRFTDGTVAEIAIDPGWEPPSLDISLEGPPA